MASPELPALPLPPGVRARTVPGIRGLAMHLLESGHPAGAPGGSFNARPVAHQPLVLLLHGFPELAYSWRRVMPALADAGYHVVAPDQRGYGRTTGWNADFDADLAPFHLPGLVDDLVALVAALGAGPVHAVVGHDFGAPVAAWCALTRPEVFRSVVLMSAPFGGVPAATAGTPPAAASLHQQLAALPRPRLHYQRHYSSRDANAQLLHCPQGLHALLRAYYHVKSADHPGNTPHPLAGASAAEMAQLPTYYVMDASKTMAETVAPDLPTPAQVAACTWLPETELAVYVAEYQRTGFQGGLNWYRSADDARQQAWLQRQAGQRITVPAAYLAGAQDWGTWQRPGQFEAMQRWACADLRACQLLPGAGHWVQQEQPALLNQHLLAFLAGL